MKSRNKNIKFKRIPPISKVEIRLVNRTRYMGDVQPGCFYKRGNKYIVEVSKKLSPTAQWVVLIHELMEMLDMTFKGKDIEYQVYTTLDKMKSHYKANILEYTFRKLLNIPAYMLSDEFNQYRDKKELGKYFALCSKLEKLMKKS